MLFLKFIWAGCKAPWSQEETFHWLQMALDQACHVRLASDRRSYKHRGRTEWFRDGISLMPLLSLLCEYLLDTMFLKQCFSYFVLRNLYLLILWIYRFVETEFWLRSQIYCLFASIFEDFVKDVCLWIWRFRISQMSLYNLSIHNMHKVKERVF